MTQTPNLTNRGSLPQKAFVSSFPAEALVGAIDLLVGMLRPLPGRVTFLLDGNMATLSTGDLPEAGIDISRIVEMLCTGLPATAMPFTLTLADGQGNVSLGGTMSAGPEIRDLRVAVMDALIIAALCREGQGDAEGWAVCEPRRPRVADALITAWACSPGEVVLKLLASLEPGSIREAMSSGFPEVLPVHGDLQLRRMHDWHCLSAQEVYAAERPRLELMRLAGGARG